eukprot:TRINITY_DN15661_c0_g2_i1.p1 TRINITY_DN15661_c0_g2~~TRINITY_DN15661_c0_g2_i1.p1  ORF type:complete len:994 (+),score=226.39 TRINITY_DN15661_c0_g2_i1:65-3046(+)
MVMSDDVLLEDDDEDDAPEWMKLLEGPKKVKASSSSLTDKKSATSKSLKDDSFISEVDFFSQDIADDGDNEIPAPETPVAAPATPPSHLQDTARSPHDTCINQLLSLLFVGKAQHTSQRVQQLLLEYLRMRTARPAFPRRLVIVRGPPGAGSSQWAFDALRRELTDLPAFGDLLPASSEALAVQLAHVCCATDFVSEFKDGQRYEDGFSLRSRLEGERSAALNEARMRLTMDLGVDPIYLDGSYPQLWQLRPYVELADRMGYIVSAVLPEEVCSQWQDVNFLVNRQPHFQRSDIEEILLEFESLPRGSEPRIPILGSERPEVNSDDALEDSTSVVLPPNAVLFKLENLLLQGSELLRYVPPDGDGWGVNGEINGEWNHFREKADGSCLYDDRMHWCTRTPDDGNWSLAELSLLTELRNKASTLKSAALPSAVSHPSLFLHDDGDEDGAVSAAAAANAVLAGPPQQAQPPASAAARRAARAANAAAPVVAVKRQETASTTPASRAERLRARMQTIKQEQQDGGAAKRPRLETPFVVANQGSSAAPKAPDEDEEVSASTFLAAVKTRLVDWGKVEQYHEFVIALSGSIDAKAAVRILRGHDDLLSVFQRKFCPKADLRAIKREIDEDVDEDRPTPPSSAPPGAPGFGVKQELSGKGVVKEELGARPPPKPPPGRPPVKQELGVKAELGLKVKQEMSARIPRPPAYGPNEPRPSVSVGDDSDDEELDEASITSAVKRGRDECIAHLAKTIFKREREMGLGTRQRLAMVHYASRVAAKPRFPRELFILRGVPGIGKTDFAMMQLMESAGFEEEERVAARLTHVCAVDDFFETFAGDASVYKFEAHRLEQYHRRNEVRVRLAMEAGIHPLFVDCPNLGLWEMQPYMALAERLGYVVTIVEPQDINRKCNDAGWLEAASATSERKRLGKAHRKPALDAMVKVFEPMPEYQDPHEVISAAKRPSGSRVIQAGGYLPVPPAGAPPSRSMMQVKAEAMSSKR